jgi:hypothetical protein
MSVVPSEANQKQRKQLLIDVLKHLMPAVRLLDEHPEKLSKIYVDIVTAVNRVQEEFKGLVNPKDAFDLYLYARDVIKGRWPEAESILVADPKRAYYYAMDVIKGRWPEAENTILTDPSIAFMYARDVIGDRWLEAEPIINTNKYYASEYQHFLGWLEHPNYSEKE